MKPWARRGAAPCRCIALGEADETWALIVADAARGELKDITYRKTTRKAARANRVCSLIHQFPGRLSSSINSISYPKPRVRCWAAHAAAGIRFI